MALCFLYGCGAGQPAPESIRPAAAAPFTAPQDTVDGGTALPARGEVRLPLIFVRFEKDDRPQPYWPGQLLEGQPESAPKWMHAFIDAFHAAAFPATQYYENLTHYFHTASQGRLRLAGEVYHIAIPDSMRGRSLSETNRYVLEHLFGAYDSESEGPTAGLARLPAGAYDSWKPLHISALTPQTEQQHRMEKDGILDYALIIYRHRRGWEHPFKARWNAIARLGSGSFALGDGTLVKGSGRQVSGATALFTNPQQTAEFIYHEIAHHLLGSPHPYKGGSGAHPAHWSLFNSYLSNQSINAWERERLGWGRMRRLEFTADAGNEATPPPPITLQLGDFLSSGDAAAFSVSGSHEREEQLMVFEHRSRRHEAIGAGSTYDNASLNKADKGLFIFTIRPPYSYREQNIRSFPADGHFSWEIAAWNEACGEGNFQPVLRKAAPNPRGVSYRDVFVISPEEAPASVSDSLFSLFVRAEAPGRCHSYTRGEYHETAFGPQSVSRKRWFSAFTNPGSLLSDDSYSGISAYVHEQTPDSMKVSFSTDPFLPGIGPLDIDQDVFFYSVSGAAADSVITIPEETELRLSQAARLYIDPEITLDIRGRIITAGGDEIRGRHALQSLRAREGLPVFEFSADVSGPQRAAF